MKTLFICSGNVARSQIAEAYYNHFTKTKNAFSAGTNPNTPRLYPKIPTELCKIMKEEGIDISNQKVKLITEKMVKDARKIYIICEKEACPDFLLNSNKITFWNIKDPFKMSIENMKKIRDQIKQQVIKCQQ